MNLIFMVSLSGVEDLPNLLSMDFFENERSVFIGAAVPPSLIVLILLRSIPGYLALSGLFNGGLFF